MVILGGAENHAWSIEHGVTKTQQRCFDILINIMEYDGFVNGTERFNVEKYWISSFFLILVYKKLNVTFLQSIYEQKIKKPRWSARLKFCI